MLEVFFTFLKTGFAHIIPDGPDHVLFVLGLFLICRAFTSLIWQVTLFTVAHSMTMGLAMAGVLQLPSRPVEVLIALSIAFVAVENIFRKDLSRWRHMVVFASGLVHGLGFAHAFQEHTLPTQFVPVSLLGMSIGVEIGQVAVVSIAFLIFGNYWNRAWYRPTVVIPASFCLMIIGLWWAIERIQA